MPILCLVQFWKHALLSTQTCFLFLILVCIILSIQYKLYSSFSWDYTFISILFSFLYYESTLQKFEQTFWFSMCFPFCTATAINQIVNHLLLVTWGDWSLYYTTSLLHIFDWNSYKGEWKTKISHRLLGRDGKPWHRCSPCLVN